MALEGGNLTRAEARLRSELIRDVSYDVHLDLTADEETFPTRTVIRFATTGATDATFLDLTVRSVDRLVVNGREIDPDPAFEGTRLTLSGLGGDNEVVVEATGEYERQGVGLHRFVDPEDGAVYLHTQFEPFDAHRVFACFDQPDLKAPVQLTVDAPEAWTLVSNTEVAGRDGRRWIFERTPPLSTYLIALVAGPLVSEHDRHGEVPLGFYCRESMARHLEHEELFDLTRRGLDFFTEAFDQPYPFVKYDQLYVPEFVFGAMENPGCVTFSEGYLFRGKVTEAERESRANTLLHELAHMWFGDLVTMRWWDDLWLNESFATFMATLACERATRFTNAWVTFSNEEKAWARRQDQLPTTHPISTDASDLHTVLQNFDGITYAKGASVLRQLVAWVGEEAFLEGVRRYFRRFAWGNAELADLLAELEDTSGRDLDPWSSLWLETAGMNTLAPSVEVDGDRYEQLDVVQRATERHPTLRPHRLAVGLFDLDGEKLRRRRSVELDVTGERTGVDELVGEPVADLVLVNDRDLAFAKVAFDERSLTTIERGLAGLDDALARTLCWSGAWEMVRDAQLPGRRFVSLVRGNVDGEDDVGVLQTLLGRARAAAELYGDPSNTRHLLAALADDARGYLGSATAGGDQQLAWARHWIAAATTDEQLTEVRRLLDGELGFDGLAVDTELRWHIVRALASAGAVDDDVIAAEHERDPSDMGQRHAEGARAARPTAEAKRQAWERIVEDRDISHSLMKSLMRGFVQRGQEDLLRPYVPRYFEVLDRIWDERTLEVAMDFTEFMYPVPVVDPEVVQRTDAITSRESTRAPMRRTLLEQRDTVVRALAARQLDASTGD